MNKTSFSAEYFNQMAALCAKQGIGRLEFIRSFERHNQLAAASAWFRVNGQ